MTFRQKIWSLGILFGAAIVFALTASFVYPVKTHVLSGMPAADGAWEHSESGQYYTVDVKVPARMPLRTWFFSGADRKVRFAIEQFFVNQIQRFKTESGAETINITDNPWMEGRKYAYKVGYQEYASPHFVSYRFDIYEDTGGAHPNVYYKTFVFDRRSKEVPLSALFMPGSDYLTILSRKATASITEELQNRRGGTHDPLFAEGLAPKEDNFQNFVLDGETLRLFFPPYQVASYAAGTFEVSIPFSDLQDIIRPDIP
jgi:hypothetical protein